MLASLRPGARKEVVRKLRSFLREKGVKIHSHSNVPALAEENLTIKELRGIFRDHVKHLQLESEDTQQLKAYYLRQRVSRLTRSSEKLRKSISRELRKDLINKGIISGEQVESWKGLQPGQRLKNIIFYAANFLDYLEIEDVFTRVMSKESLSIVVKEARNTDQIKNMTNSEILPFLDKLIIHQDELESEDVQEALDTIIETFISDHHYYKLAADRYLSLKDVYDILERRIYLPGRQGKIGQKAAGMILAHKILAAEAGEFAEHIRIPESFYLTSDVFFECLASHTYNFSSLRHRLKEGSISEPQLIKEYPKIRKLIMSTVIPDIIRIELREILQKAGNNPLIIRSSSLLEDSVSAFSGKYDSYFFANQKLHDDPEQDLEHRVDKLIENILRVYASVLRPEALIYRRERGLLDIDERMCVLIQFVEGRRYGKYYFPALAGVGLSYNHRMNTEKIKWNDPVLRVGLGLGTGIVDIRGRQVKVVYPGNPDYSTILDFYDILKTSQRWFDVLNLETDTVETISKEALFTYINTEAESNSSMQDFIWILGNYFLSTAEQDYLTAGIGLANELDTARHVFTLKGMKNTKFYRLTDLALRTLAEKYQPSDMEFTVNFSLPEGGGVPGAKGERLFDFTVVQCRQLTGSLDFVHQEIPTDLAPANVICEAEKSVTSGYAPNIDYIIYVDPEKYYNLDENRMFTVARYIRQLNHALRKKRFLLIGPGRWGSSTPQYGIKVSYSEIYKTRALVEIARKLGDDRYAETSLGSHFGNDLRESQIVTFSIYPGYANTVFREDLLQSSPNRIAEFLDEQQEKSWVADTVRVINVKDLPSEDIDPGRQVLHIIANSEKERGIIFLGTQRETSQSYREQKKTGINGL